MSVEGDVQRSGVRNLAAALGSQKFLDVRHSKFKFFGKECRVGKECSCVSK